MSVRVDVQLGNQDPVSLGHGAMIGRLWSADLHIDDGRVSEAHAMISFRGADVHLLALRGRFRVGQKALADVVLTEGLVIHFAADIAMTVLSINVPATVLTINAPQMPEQALLGVCSLYTRPNPRIVAGWKPDAVDHLWTTGASWRRGSSDMPLVPGQRWTVDDTVFVIAERAVKHSTPTRLETAFHTPMTIVARFDTVHLVRHGQPTVVLTGHIARAISELVDAGTGLGWEHLAALVWGDDDKNRLRRRWDTQLHRLRQRLKTHGVRQDLVRADGSGLVELVLGAEDRAVNAT